MKRFLRAIAILGVTLVTLAAGTNTTQAYAKIWGYKDCSTVQDANSVAVEIRDDDSGGAFFWRAEPIDVCDTVVVRNALVTTTNLRVKVTTYPFILDRSTIPYGIEIQPRTDVSTKYLMPNETFSFKILSTASLGFFAWGDVHEGQGFCTAGSLPQMSFLVYVPPDVQ